jgi:hypothetical protein
MRAQAVGLAEASAHGILLLSLLVAASACSLDLSLEPRALPDAGAGSPPEEDASEVPEPLPVDATCEELAERLSGCEGNPAGTWRLIQFCPDGALQDPLEGTCETITRSDVEEAQARLLLTPGGQFVFRWQRLAASLRFSFPLSCYGGDTSPCRGVHFGGTCVLEQGGRWCGCDLTQQVVDFPLEGVWARSGGRIVFSFENPEGPSVQEGVVCLQSQAGTPELWLELPRAGGLPAFRSRWRLEGGP